MHSRAVSNASVGFGVAGGSTVIGCTATGNQDSGFQLGQGSTANDSTARDNRIGFQLSLQSRVSQVAASANAFYGIFAGGDGVSITDSNVSGNGSDGILVGIQSLIARNKVHSNIGAGIHAASRENRIEDNESTSNGTGIKVDGTSNLIVRNACSQNGVEYVIATGNMAGAISTDPATAGPWANFDH